MFNICTIVTSSKVILRKCTFVRVAAFNHLFGMALVFLTTPNVVKETIDTVSFSYLNVNMWIFILNCSKPSDIKINYYSVD